MCYKNLYRFVNFNYQAFKNLAGVQNKKKLSITP